MDGHGDGDGGGGGEKWLKEKTIIDERHGDHSRAVSEDAADSETSA